MRSPGIHRRLQNPGPLPAANYAASRQALAVLPPLPGRPAVRQVAGWITGLPGYLDPADEERLRAIRTRCPELDAAVRHVTGFARMIKDLSGDRETLTMWMGAVDTDLPALRSFTAGLRRDLDAVVAGLTLKYNSGAVEGTSTASSSSKRRCTDERNPIFCASAYSWAEHRTLFRDNPTNRW